MKFRDIIIKDLKVVLSDRKALAIMIVMPIILSTILGFALSGSFSDGFSTNKIKIAVVKKYDLGSETDKLINDLKEEPILNSNLNDDAYLKQLLDNLNPEDMFFNKLLDSEEIKNILDYSIMDESSARDELKEGNISSLIILPENYIYSMYKNFLLVENENIEINVIGHPERSIKTSIVESIIKAFYDITSTNIVNRNVIIDTATEDKVNSELLANVDNILNELSINSKNNVNISYEKVDGKDPISSIQYYSIAITTMFILYVAGYGSKLLLDEKFNKTYSRMAIAGISKWKIAFGKLLMIFIFGLIQISIMIAFSSFILKANWGNILHVAIICIISIFTVASLGIMLAAISYIAENYKVADLTQSLVFQVMALLGGSFFPIEVMPDFVKKLSNFILNGLALKSFIKISTGYGLKDILSYLIPLFFMGIVFLVLAIYILKREERRGLNVKHNKVKVNEPA